MRRVVIGIMAVLMLGCVGLVGIGYFYGIPLLRNVVEAGHDNVVEVMEDSLYQSSLEAIAGGDEGSKAVRIRERDLTVNNTAVAGEAGWETGTSGTVVYGFDLRVTPDGLSLGIGEEALFSGVPVIEAGRLELTDVRVIDTPSFMGFLTADEFERVIEGGLNDAFAAHDLAPTSLSLRDGEMTVNVSPVSDTVRGSGTEPAMDPGWIVTLGNRIDGHLPFTVY